ncbi:MAG: hypothetical protein N2Z40_02730 [Caldimicrobium sp.]|nr:hypothetical protein [Caldimicrobium sp.]
MGYTKRVLKRTLISLALGFLTAFVLSIIIIPKENSKRVGSGKGIPLLTTGKPELCLLCHEEKIQEKSHGVEMLGCSGCHLGNPLASTKVQAHRGLVKNPADLRVIEKTCGQPNCHPQDIKKVRNSLMATNHGIISRLLFVFREDGLLKATPHLGVADLLKGEASFKGSYALDYYRKLCGSCHLYLEKGKIRGFVGEKGGGCSACHLAEFTEDQRKKRLHPKLEKEVPLERCVRCHNRSGRIGFTYQGLYETSQGGIYDLKWVDGRELIKIESDVHHKAGLHCTDCHIREEIMGDGNFYKNIEEALEVRCETCHQRLLKTDKGRVLTNLKFINGNLYLKGKFTGKLHLVKGPAKDCDRDYHRRLSCSACHAHHMPQCMGCHVRYDPKERHLDKIKVMETRGLWEEYESYRELLKPVLAVKKDKIVPVTPG